MNGSGSLALLGSDENDGIAGTGHLAGRGAFSLISLLPVSVLKTSVVIPIKEMNEFSIALSVNWLEH